MCRHTIVALGQGHRLANRASASSKSPSQYRALSMLTIHDSARPTRSGRPARARAREVDRGPRSRRAASPARQRVDRLFRDRAVLDSGRARRGRRVQVERIVRGYSAARLGQPVGHPQVPPAPLTLGERVVRDVAQHVASEPPHALVLPRG